MVFTGLGSSPDEARKIGESLLLLLDRLSNMEKAKIIAKVFIGYVYNQLTAEEFQRVCQAIDVAFLSDLRKLIGCAHNVGHKGTSTSLYMQALYPSGLTRMVAGKTYKTAGELFFEISKLGRKLINAYLHGQRYSE